MRPELSGFYAHDAFEAIEQLSQPLSTSSAPLGPGIGPGVPIGTMSGNTENTIFGSGLDTMPFNQQSKNGCGSASLANIAGYLLGQPVDRNALDHEFRRWGIFSPPTEMIDYARGRGLEAEMYNDGTWEELKGFVDRGIPTQALLSMNEKGGDLHYVAVVGYGKDAAGNEYVMFHDSNRGDDPSTPVNEGEIRRMPLDEFRRKWESVPFGFDNFFLAYAPKGTELPPGRDEGIEGTLTAADGIANLTNGLDRIGHFWESPLTFTRGVLEVEAGVVQTLGGGISGALQLGGDWAHEKVEGIPVVENIVQPVADLISGVGAVGADIVEAVGEATEDLGEGFEKLGQGDVVGFGVEVGEAVVEVGRGVGNAVVDGGRAVINTVKDIFSGW